MNNLLAALGEIAKKFAEKSKQKSIEVGAPKDIKFSQTSPIEENGQESVEVHATHPAVAAFEYGSGIHATQGAKGKYPIEPKNKDYLAFFWPKVEGEPGFRRLPDGRVLLKHVEHPGVEAKPFLKPTLEENKDEYKQILGEAFKADILIGTNKVETIEIK